MNDKEIYRFQPTGKGFRLVSDDVNDINRGKISLLYPDVNRRNIFTEEDMQYLVRTPFRPVVCAYMVPQYRLDMHTVMGMAGYGRFAVVKGETVCWLDEFQHVETEYECGELRYTVWDSRISEGKIRVTFIASKGMTGMVARLDCSDVEKDIRLYYLHGGILAWNSHSPLDMPYREDMCFENALINCGDYIEIAPGMAEGEFTYPGLSKVDSTGISMGYSASRKIKNYIRKLIVRVHEQKMYIASPDALLNFAENKLNTVRTANGGVACGVLSGRDVYYTAVGCGDAVKSADLAEMFTALQMENRKIADRLVVHSGDPCFDGAVAANAFHTEGMFADNVIVHGNLSWRKGYVGWRNAYGLLAYGMYDQAYTHFDNHFTKSLITQGDDAGAFPPTLEESQESGLSWVFYGMEQTFMDQAKKYWEYTGDKEYAARLLPIVEGCIARENRRIKPGEEMLYENSLNTWISDSHWTVFGQCTQASAHLYNMHMLASDLAEDGEKKAFYRGKAEEIYRDMHRLLWQKRKGVFGYARDLLGNKLFHPEPELADVYHTTEFGLTDKYQTYQMLDWVEANLRSERTDNGGKLYWNSNWYPNSGRTYTHSTYEVNTGEEMNLVLAYQEIGLTEPAYEIFKSIYMSLYGGRHMDEWSGDCDIDMRDAKGLPALIREVALDMPCHMAINGTPRRNPVFADTIGMFGRALYEGVLGIRPKLQKGEVWLTPCIPAELPDVDIQSSVLDYTYKKTDGQLRVGYHMKHPDCALQLKLNLPVAAVEDVTVNGISVKYCTEPAFLGVQLYVSVENAGDGEICVSFTEVDILPAEERHMLHAGDTLTLQYPGETIEEIVDPQGLLNDACVEDGVFTAKVTGEAGSGVFFLKMCTAGTAYIRPVKIRIREEKVQKLFRSFREEFAAPYTWHPVNMDSLFSAPSPEEAVKAAQESSIKMPHGYNWVNLTYYWMHLTDRLHESPLHEFSDRRWKSLIDENNMVMTGEGIPFRTKKEGNYLAVATLASTEFPDRVTAEINDTARAAYLLITGITFPMQSHVENLRITFTYEDGVQEEHPLVNPWDIGDMWGNCWKRYHDTPANGFENISGFTGALSSAGLDLTKPILTDTEAHILRFKLRENVKVRSVEMRTIANDVLFALMGVTLLK